ncbi:CaiB/BaiF CoA transferase family protein [Marisediminicola antarctica]|uniref:Carnitine dehydratase n=1 Tax=Marisediminicola antarctica TaxID=674079 RepID=A0A7L5AGS4_9MICO|nr:CoA transferase [Marisediminicola antarctica]QHO69457.1 carnitine dehydratase [Marisediminicola antarctica]
MTKSSADVPSKLPLEGLLVADFSRVLAGPLATMTLADLGARVIKVERPGSGDDTRQWGPPFSETGSTYFESVNRNKESICLDLSDEADRRVAVELALRADIVVENFRPGGMEKVGLGYERLSRDNPRLIYASISGFGSAGGADLPGYDFMVQALGGLMSITGDSAGSPTKVGVALVDIITAKDATIGILAALNTRNATGIGVRLEVNLLSSLQGALANQGQAYLGAGVMPQRMGNAHPSIAPYELLNCADGPLAVACGNDSQFKSILGVLSLDDFISDARFTTNRARVINREQLVAMLESRLVTGTASAWQDAFTSVGVPAGQVGTIADGIELAESLGLAPTISVQDATGMAVGTQIRNPITWSPPLVPRTAAPPALDEHGDAVRGWLESFSTPVARAAEC